MAFESGRVEMMIKEVFLLVIRVSADFLKAKLKYSFLILFRIKN